MSSFCIFEKCLDSNPESCYSKQARYQLSHPSPKKQQYQPQENRIKYCYKKLHFVCKNFFQIFHRRRYQIIQYILVTLQTFAKVSPKPEEDKRQRYTKRSVSRDLRHLGQAELLLAGGGVGRHNSCNLHLLPLLLKQKKSTSNKMNVK
jgi:hypothetical protein